ncbi:TlyA family RNA methyltransferase [Anaerosalibacter massiliensis]|uniref:TlyA family RNA methyltransferase n=1 Tax=Anaerosalibacter massiliensis TaxID=1347392 RepID=A0A9X2MF92_9FIRM|nr:TlyA family RNA methyltransferase [Anaerosalibacter massiliensis]MCR2042609.1 TlyA family RNA methyltransferase [Anaerosalibacter massiliensis]
MKKERIDTLLVEKKLVKSREKAKRIVMEGIVFVDEQRIDKPSERIDITKDIIIKGDPIPYVSRGGLKLEKAIEYFNIDLKDKLAIDVGASTGGFTDCMLKKGARKVYAIDVGYGQIDWNLRQDDRVIVKERTNIRYVTQDDIGELVDFVSIDVSFISLKLVLPVVKKLIKEDGEIVSLVKPQFEAGKEKVGKKGIIRDKKVHEEVLLNVYEFCRELKLFVKNVTYSPVKGATGNIEYLFYLTGKISENNEKMESNLKEIVNKSHQVL